MNIIYFYQYFGTPKGGWSTRVYEMCRRWVQKGHRVCVVTSLYDKSDLTASGWYRKHQIDGIEVYVINVTLSNKHGYLYRMYTFLVYALLATFLGLRRRCDLIVASSGPLTIGIPALLIKWIKRRPMVFEVRDLWPGGAIAFGIIKHPLLIKLANWAEGLCYRNSQLVVTCSQGMADSIKTRYPQTEVITVTNAADLGLFREKEVDLSKTRDYEDVSYFVYTGTLGLIDDCAQILHAAEELQRRGREDILLLIIGDGKERPALENQAREKQLNNLKFLGQMPKEDLVGFVRGAKGSILTVKPIPFMDHCSPNKIFDAFAAGVPILQTTCGWIKDLVETENCGVNIFPNNPGAFADAIEKLNDDPDLQRLLAENAARLGETIFNREVLSNKMLNALIEVSGKPFPSLRTSTSAVEKAVEHQTKE